MITIYCDFQKYFQGEQHLSLWVVQKIQDYIPLRQNLRRALDDPDHTYTVYLQHLVVAEWLRDLRKYPEHLVRWEEYLPEISNNNSVLNTDAHAVSAVQMEHSQSTISVHTGLSTRTNPLSPQVTLDGVFMSGRQTPGKITIVNPNSESIFCVKLTAETASSSLEWNELQPNIPESQAIQFLVPKTKNTKHTLLWTLSCESGGQQWRFDGHIEISVRQFQTNEVDAMFEGL